MPKTIYVPQGFSARLQPGTINLGIDSIYSDGFSTCNLLVCIGEKEVSLIHIDIYRTYTPQAIREEIEKIKGSKKIFVIYRDTVGEFVKGRLLESLKSYKISWQKVDDTCQGVSIGIKDKSLKFWKKNESPTELIHHPQEIQLIATQRIYQMIGMRAIVATNQCFSKPLDVFSNHTWQPYSENDLKIYQGHDLTREEMNSFTKIDSFFDITKKLSVIQGNLKKEGFLIEENPLLMLQSIAPSMESYLNEYDYKIPFSRNLRESIEHYTKLALGNKTFTEEDKVFSTKLKELLDKSGDVFDVVSQFMSEHEKEKNKTYFGEKILDDYKLYVKHYNERKCSEEMQKKNGKDKENAILCTKSAKKHYLEKKYQAADTLFTEALNKFTYSCLNTDPDLATAYYNLGRTLFQLGEYPLAHSYLEICLYLRKKLPNIAKDDIIKTEKALQECEAKLPKKEVSGLQIN